MIKVIYFSLVKKKNEKLQAKIFNQQQTLSITVISSQTLTVEINHYESPPTISFLVSQYHSYSLITIITMHASFAIINKKDITSFSPIYFYNYSTVIMIHYKLI